MKKLILIFILFVFAAAPVFSQVTKGTSETKKITFKREQTGGIRELPDLIIKEEKFSDENLNKAINANEDCAISFKVENIGKGVAQNVKVKVSLKNDANLGVTFEEMVDLGDMPGETQNDVTIPIQGRMNTEDGYAEFVIQVLESRGFDAFPLEFKIETRRFAEPMLVVADAVFSTEDGGNIKLNYPINLKVLVQNIGEGTARDVNVSFQLPGANCIFLGETDKFDFDFLNSGETRELDFLFTATRRYTDSEIPVQVDISEAIGRFARDTLLYVGLEENLTAKSQVVIKGLPTGTTAIVVEQ